MHALPARRTLLDPIAGALFASAVVLTLAACLEHPESLPGSQNDALAAHRDAVAAEGPVACLEIDETGICEAIAECEWLHPGCSGGAPALDRCVPAGPCTGDAECPDGTVCRTVDVDPCTDGVCDACGMYAERCVPPEDVGEPACFGAASAESCATTEGCFWFVPGCDADPDGPPTGCYLELDCAASDDVCPGELTCLEAQHDPCWDADCRACSAGISVCAR